MNNEEKILNMIEKMNDNFNERFENIENGLKENKKTIYNINDKVDNIDKRFVTLDDKVGSLDNKVDNIGDKLDSLKAKNAERHMKIIKKIDEMESTISRIEINTAENWRDIAKLKSTK